MPISADFPHRIVDMGKRGVMRARLSLLCTDYAFAAVLLLLLLTIALRTAET